MKRLVTALFLAALAAPVLADPQPEGPEVLERDAQGHATKVKLDGQVVDVCTPQRSDGCINPRDAGLDQGNREINYWPGRPASEIDKPLPVEQPEAGKTAEEAGD